MKLSLEKIAKLIGASVHGEPSKEILGINTLNSANSDEISYATSKK
jgi:UDP-3-O-[3-hydroxymyristoyl] glucosamine N-acyltransferase